MCVEAPEQWGHHALDPLVPSLTGTAGWAKLRLFELAVVAISLTVEPLEARY